MKKLLFLTFLLTPLLNYGQTFSAALLLGSNISQIDGDNFSGYDKFGFNTGAKAYVHFEEKWSGSFELLFSQKGSKTKRTLADLKYQLNYVEIPVLVHYHDRQKAQFGAGLSYSRLLNYKKFSDGLDITPPEALFFTSDLSWLADVTFFPKENGLGFNFRYSHSLLPIARWSSSTLPNNKVVNKTLCFRVIYHIRPE